jgi:hypothetical protein
MSAGVPDRACWAPPRPGTKVLPIAGLRTLRRDVLLTQDRQMNAFSGRTRNILMLAFGVVGNLFLPWVLARACQGAGIRDFADCHEGPNTERGQSQLIGYRRQQRAVRDLAGHVLAVYHRRPPRAGRSDVCAPTTPTRRPSWYSRPSTSPPCATPRQLT